MLKKKKNMSVYVCVCAHVISTDYPGEVIFTSALVTGCLVPVPADGPQLVVLVDVNYVGGNILQSNT